MLNKFVTGIIGGLALASSVAFSASAAEKVNVGICVSWPGYAMLKIAEENNLSPDLEFNFTFFEDPIGGHLATAAGQIDVYMCTGDYTPLIAERGTPVVNVAFTNPSYGVDHIIFSPGVTADNIKGQKVAAPQAYIGHLLMGLMLESINVVPGDVEWVNLNADEAVGPMMSGDLAAAYLYEPWISKVMANSEGAHSAINTAEPAMLKTGIFMDVIYMNKNFIAERRQTALDVLKARWNAVQYWHDNTEEVNKSLAEFLQWPAEDIGYVIGTNGKFFEGGIYMYDFDESARVCGALDGKPPFDLKNGSMVDVVTLINEWWVKLGLMDKVVDSSGAVDCSLMGDLVASGYRQSISAK
ncbi:MAG: ABC transporter substrate-binding protein [Rhodospirillales bacterium]|nr:ABC transporter substrate-binding protein [Rhodospirillales bacterium]